MQCTPDFGARHTVGKLHEDDLAQIAERFVHHHAAHPLDRQRIAQVDQKTRLSRATCSFIAVPDLLGVTSLSTETCKTGLRLCVIGGNLHRHVVIFERHVTVAFAERPFGLEQFRIDQTLDHEFGVSRHIEIDGHGLDGADRRAGESARDRHFVLIDGQLLWSGENHDRRAAHHDGDRHRLFQLAVFLPVQITTRVPPTRAAIRTPRRSVVPFNAARWRSPSLRMPVSGSCVMHKVAVR